MTKMEKLKTSNTKQAVLYLACALGMCVCILKLVT